MTAANKLPAYTKQEAHRLEDRPGVSLKWLIKPLPHLAE
jgi:hypothetical protein